MPTELTYQPGDFQGVPYNEDAFYSDTDSDFLSGPGVANTFTGPFMEPGEAYELTVTCTLSAEPEDNQVVLEVMDDAENNYIKKDVIGSFGGPTLELSVVVSFDMLNESDFGSPTIRVNAIGSDSFNYFVDVQGIQIRRQSRTQASQNIGAEDGSTEAGPSQESFD